MDSPTQTQTEIELDVGELTEKLKEARLVLEQDPDKVWFDIRSDSNGPYLACRVITDSRKFAFRLESAQFIGGSTKPATYPADFYDFYKIEGEGQVRLTFTLPSVNLRKPDDPSWKYDVGVQQNPADKTPFPSNGEYYFSADEAIKVVRVLNLAAHAGVREPARMRYHDRTIEVYTTDSQRTFSASIPAKGNPELGLWDVQLPRNILRRVGELPGVVIDHMHSHGIWASDGKTFSFAQSSPSDVIDYSFDVPGLVRAIKAFSNTFVLSKELWEAIKVPGYYLVVFSVGCVESRKLDSTSVNFHSDFRFEPGEAVSQSLNYRGSPMAVVLDSAALASYAAEEPKVHLTSWPCSPYVVEFGGIDIALTPPVVNPGSLADYLPAELSEIQTVLKNWVGDFDRLVARAFMGSQQDLHESSAAVRNHGWESPNDTLFLVRTPNGFVRTGGVDPFQLACCLFEFQHAAVYPTTLVERLLEKDYWQTLDVFIYDPEHVKENGPDPLSPDDAWVTWNRWVDPKYDAARDGAGRLKRPDEPQRRKQARFLPVDLRAPEVPRELLIQEKPTENPAPEPISKTEESHVVGSPPEAPVEERVQTLIVDANYVVWRNFYQKGLSTMRHPSQGIYTGIAFGFLRSLRSWVQTFRPSKILAVWDGGVADWRKEMIPDYKERDRSKIPQDKWESLLEQREWLQNNLGLLGVHSIRIPKCEADDIIALLAQTFEPHGRVMIVTSDLDFTQLITNRIHIYKDDKSEVIQDASLALPGLLKKVTVGDSSDNIGGIPNFGKTTFDRLVEEIQNAGKEVTIENIMEIAPTHKTKRVRRLAEEESKAIIDRNLTVINLEEGIKRLPQEAMLKAIQHATTPIAMQPQAFSKWASSLAFDSITNQLSSWEQDFTPLR